MAINVKPDSPNTITINSNQNSLDITNVGQANETITISTGETQTVNVSAVGPQGSRGIQGIQGLPGNITGSVGHVTASGNISASGDGYFNQKIHILNNTTIWDNGSVVYIGNVDNSSKDVRIRAAGSDKMIVRTDGKVGIGTVNPAEKLTVEGDISASGICMLLNL